MCDRSRPVAGAIESVRAIEIQIATAEVELLGLRADLARMKLLAGLRPGDGSDQAALFENEDVGLFN